MGRKDGNRKKKAKQKLGQLVKGQKQKKKLNKIF